MESFSESAARIPEDGGAPSRKTSGPVLARNAEEIGHAKQIVTDAQIEGEMGSDLPIVLDKEVELILIVPANSAASVLRLAGRRIRLFVVEELCIGRFTGLILL